MQIFLYIQQVFNSSKNLFYKKKKKSQRNPKMLYDNPKNECV